MTMQQVTTQTSSKSTPPFVVLQGLKYQWHIQQIDQDIARNIAFKHNISLPIAHVLAARGCINDDDIRAFLFGSYEHDVASPTLFKGMETALIRLMRAVQTKEKILIFGDYDVDGITSTSLILAALLPLGASINFFLPHREKDGYGLSAKVVNQAAKNGYSLIITVDNGITAFEAAQQAQRHGIDLIITDHHKPLDTLPPALAIIDPNQNDCSYPFKYLAGVGVAFKLISALYQALNITRLPDKIYELLLLGTVADVVPLVGENRFWVRYGLSRVNQDRSQALCTLSANSSLTKSTFNSLDLGFMIAPQINALGRLSDPRDAVKFLISADVAEIERIGTILKTMNDERKKVERTIYDAIEKSIETKHINLDKEYVIIATNDAWPSGVIGLVAGKLTHNYGRPTLLFHLDKDGYAKGSCRSIEAFDIFQALHANKDLLEHYGGHSHAAGVKIKADRLPELKERLTQALAQQFALADLQPKLQIEAPLNVPEANSKMMSDLEQLEPFGNKNPQPLFVIYNVSLIKQPQLLKEKHVKCMIFSEGVLKPVIFFNRPDILGFLQTIGDKPFHLAAHVIKNEWNGLERIELQGVDIAVP